jgi:hypothetical protein
MSNSHRVFLFAAMFLIAVASLYLLHSEARNRDVKNVKTESVARIPVQLRGFPAPGYKSDTAASFFQATDELQVLLFELRPYGFIPAEITVAPGKYLIAVQNRSGMKDLTFRLDRDNGARLSESRASTKEWKSQVTLGRGTYILSEASEPSWRSVIHVSNP